MISASPCLLPAISGRILTLDAIYRRATSFIKKCLCSDSISVSATTRYSVYFGRVCSPLGRNAFSCCTRFGFGLDKLPSTDNGILRNVVVNNTDAETRDTA